MGKGRTFRMLTVMALVSGAVWAVGGPVSAATKPKPSCSILTGNAAKTTSKLSGCTPATSTGGNATGVSKVGKGTTGTSTLTWAGKRGKTTVSFSYTIVTANPKCGTSVVKGKKTNNTEVIETGSVLTSTGTISNVVKVGDKTSATVCINAATSAESLLKGTKFVL